MKANRILGLTPFVLFLTLVLGCGPGVETETSGDLDVYELAQQPTFAGFQELFAYDTSKPFVGVNAFAFKEYASGETYAGLTGFEAYLIYGLSGQNTLEQVEGRNIWSGFVYDQVIGHSDPMFGGFGVYAYPGSSNFIEYLSNPNGEENLEAREAGLLGQWHVPSSSISESEDEVGEDLSTSLPSMEEIVDKTGLSEEQINTILAIPEDKPLAIIELLTFSDGSGEVYEPYIQATSSVLDQYGAVRNWRGKMEFLFIGNASPMFDQMVITTFPSPKAYLLMLLDGEIAPLSGLVETGLSVHWLYTAYFRDPGAE
jgi:hypothetical protein